jgi:hypothetical protein
MINVLTVLQKELSALIREKGICCQMGEGFSLQKLFDVDAQCHALTLAEEKLREAASLIREGY